MSSTKKETAIFRLTLLEKMFVLLHLPSSLGIILVAVFVGPLGNFLYLYSVSHEAIGAFYGTFISTNVEESGFIAAIQSNWYSLASNVLWYVFLFYVAFIVRYLRLRLVKAEPELVSLALNGKKDAHGIFKNVSKTIPQLVIMSVFLLVYATSVPGLIEKGDFTALSAPIYIFRSLFRSVMFGSVLWLYCASLLGLYHFGKQSLKLKSYHEDPMLGTKKLGSLSFSFSLAYLLGLTLFAGQMILGGVASQTSLVNIITVLILVPIGIVLFLAPLVSTHNRMLEAKKGEIASTDKLLSELISRIRETGEKDDQNISVNSLIRLLTLESVEKKVKSIRTWPIENPVMGEFALITASVAATLIARFIQIFLHI